MKITLRAFLIIFLFAASTFGQMKFGADIYSRYLWRGLDFGDSPAFQPSLSYTAGSFIIGAWGTYSIAASGSAYSENDLYLSYFLAAESYGSFSAIITDYYVPSAGIPFGHFKSKTESIAAHTIEGGLTYSGPAPFPISLAFYSNFSNDPDNSIYIQAGYPINLEEATLSFTVGLVTSKSDYYIVDGGNLTNLSITASRNIILTEKFSIPINVSYISSPSQDKTYLVFGASFLF